MPNYHPKTEQLVPFTGKDDPRRSNGRPKGAKSLATIVRELENEDFPWELTSVKQKDLLKQIGSPWRAIVYAAVGKAIEGDIKAMEWLRKAGYGDKMDVINIRETIEPKIKSNLRPLGEPSDEVIKNNI